MPTSPPILRDSINENSLPVHLRRRRTSGNTSITNNSNSSTTIIQTILKEIELIEVIDKGCPVHISGGLGYNANNTDKEAHAIALESGIVNAKIELAYTGDIITYPASTFTANDLIWLGNEEVTQDIDLETVTIQQILGMAISTTQMLVNIEIPYL